MPVLRNGGSSFQLADILVAPFSSCRLTPRFLSFLSGFPQSSAPPVRWSHLSFPLFILVFVFRYQTTRPVMILGPSGKKVLRLSNFNERPFSNQPYPSLTRPFLLFFLSLHMFFPPPPPLWCRVIRFLLRPNRNRCLLRSSHIPRRISPILLFPFFERIFFVTPHEEYGFFSKTTMPHDGGRMFHFSVRIVSSSPPPPGTSLLRCLDNLIISGIHFSSNTRGI